MSTRQKPKLMATLVAIVVIMAVAGYLGFDPINGRTTNLAREEDEVRLHLSVVFQLKRTKPVNISVTIGGAVEVAQGLKTSPWERNIDAPYGARVSLAVFQEQSGDAECTILRNGVIVAHEWMLGPGNIACQYVVTP